MASRPCIASSAAIHHLSIGYERLTQLRALLSSLPANLHTTATAITLLDKALSCLAAALSKLQISSPRPITGATAGKDSLSGINPCKRMRKKVQSWSIDTSVPDFDGYQWLKYGQKHIDGAAFPRSYFNCTHKNDRACPAKKTVQRKEDDNSHPPKYEVCYIMQHTCKTMETDWSLEESTSDGQAASPDQLSPASLPLQVEDMMDEYTLMEHGLLVEPMLHSTPRGPREEENNSGKSWSNLFPPSCELDFHLE